MTFDAKQYAADLAAAYGLTEEEAAQYAATAARIHARDIATDRVRAQQPHNAMAALDDSDDVIADVVDAQRALLAAEDVVNQARELRDARIRRAYATIGRGTAYRIQQATDAAGCRISQTAVGNILREP